MDGENRMTGTGEGLKANEGSDFKKADAVGEGYESMKGLKKFPATKSSF
jgi:hypothetical protein